MKTQAREFPASTSPEAGRTHNAGTAPSNANANANALSSKGNSTPSCEQLPNMLREDLSLPAAVVYASRLRNNLNWMQEFADSQQVKLAPHGKTTMTPAFFQQQITTGAWGLTLATAPQVAAAHAAGIQRVLMANQLVGKRNMTIISELMVANDEKRFDFYCLVDSVDNVHQLGRFFTGTHQALQVLLEVGVAGGRCGCRSQPQIDDVLHAISQYDSLKLAGVETYEGVISGDNAAARIREHLTAVLELCLRLVERGAFDTDKVILTGAGSAWYDLVAEVFGGVNLDGANLDNLVPVIRPGCYLIHDQGIYLEAQQKVMARLAQRCDISGDLESSLEIWAYVQSVPETGRAILGLGKRDVAFDAGLPQPALFYRPGQAAPCRAPADWQVVSIMDHHSVMVIPAGADIKVGDMIALSTSHPCLTFDKWRELCVIDDDYNVIERVQTCF